MQERRAQVRLNIPVLVEFSNPSTGQLERSFTNDFSETGMRFPTMAKLQVSQELTLTLALPFEPAAFQATGEVIWIREIARLGMAQYEVGLRFRWIEDPDRQRLVSCLKGFFGSFRRTRLRE